MAKNEEVEATVVDDNKQIEVVKPRSVSRRARPAGTVSVNPAALMMAAVKGKVPPETMREIMAVRRELVAEQAKREYYDALADFQKELKPILRTRGVRNKEEYIEKGGEEVRFRYAQIEKIAASIQKNEADHGFSHRFNSGSFKADDHTIEVTCTIHHVGGHEESSRFPSPVFFEDGKAIGQSKAQTINGAITFGRRVTLVMGFGLMTADPDPEADESKKGEAGEAVEPRSTGDAQASKKEPAGTKETLDAVFEDVTKLIETKCTGKAAQNFLATAHKHYEANRKDLLAALRTSLKLMKQGTK